MKTPSFASSTETPFALLFLIGIIGSGCGITSAGPEPDLAFLAEEAGLSLSQQRITLKPLVLCARSGLGERVVVVATEIILDHPDPDFPNPAPLTYTEIVGTGDFSRAVYLAQTIEFTGPEPTDPLPKDARPPQLVCSSPTPLSVSPATSPFDGS